MSKVISKITLVIVAVALAVIGIGCNNTASAEKGTLTFNVTDAPPKPDITSIMITLSKLEVHRAVAAQTQTTTTTTTTETTTTTTTTTATTTEEPTEQETGEWLTITIPADAKTFDLLKIKGIEQLLASAEITAGLYTQVRLTVEKAEVAISGGALQTATIPSGALKIVHPFEVVAGETTTLTLDFDADKSVNVTGNEQIMIKPVIKLMVTKTSGPKPDEFTQQQSQKLAMDFIKNGPTFLFDGIAASLTLKNTVALATTNTWEFTYEFDCSQAGYGDRTGQVLAQVITHHTAVIVVEKGSVVSAVLDGQWNEMTQEAITSGTTN